MAKNIEMNVQGSDGSYEVLYPASVSDNILLSQEMLDNLGLESGTLDNVLTTVVPSIVPVGSVFWYCNQNPPIGFLICDGSAISRTNYSQLFAVIGTTFGSGNNSTTFTLPNLLAKFVRGAGSSSSYSANFGSTQEATYEYRNQTNQSPITTPDTVWRYFPVLGLGNYDKAVFRTTYGSAMSLSGNNGTSYTSYQVFYRPYNIALTPIIKY